MELLNKRCPNCKSEDLKIHTKYQTENHGVRKIYNCKSCSHYFSETENTFLERIKKPVSLIWQVIKDRTRGQSLNAVCDVFEVSKNTVLNWEKKFPTFIRYCLYILLFSNFWNW